MNILIPQILLCQVQVKFYTNEKKYFIEGDDNVKSDLFNPSIIRNSQYIGN